MKKILLSALAVAAVIIVGLLIALCLKIKTTG